MCVNVSHTNTLGQKKFFYKVVGVKSQRHFHSFVKPSRRQQQYNYPGVGGVLDYRVGEVTVPPNGSPGIYVFCDRAGAKGNANWQRRQGDKVALIKVMASTGATVSYSGGMDTAIVHGPVLVVKRERISR